MKIIWQNSDLFLDVGSLYKGYMCYLVLSGGGGVPSGSGAVGSLGGGLLHATLPSHFALVRWFLVGPLCTKHFTRRVFKIQVLIM